MTPDSFSDGGRWLDSRAAIARGEEMVAEGADLIDVGGESTRPGAQPAPPGVQIERVVPVIRALVPLGVPISVDTTGAEVARAALDAGAVIINDVSGLRAEPGLAGVAVGAGLILMHSRGTPRDMQDDPRYDDVVSEVSAELEAACRVALAAGVGADALVIDPGLGFAKTAGHNLALLRGLNRLVRLGWPVLVGASRKSFIGRVLDLPVGERLEGSLAAAVAAVLAGAHLVRVHDVKATVRAVRLADAIVGAQGA